MRLNAPKKQEKSYSGKKKCHTIKEQLVIDAQTGKIICVCEAKGAVHDFTLFKQSKVHIREEIVLLGDKAYQGIANIHFNSMTPFKTLRKRVLTEEQMQFNSMLGSIRIKIEHVFRRIKCFKIFGHRYRNKQRKHLLRFSLVCGLFKFDTPF